MARQQVHVRMRPDEAGLVELMAAAVGCSRAMLVRGALRRASDLRRSELRQAIELPPCPHSEAVPILVRLGDEELAAAEALARSAGCSRAALLRGVVCVAIEAGLSALRECVAGLPDVAERRRRDRQLVQLVEAGASINAAGRALGLSSGGAAHAYRRATAEPTTPVLRIVEAA